MVADEVAWAAVAPRTERAVIDGGHHWLWALCPVPMGGRDLLASGDHDGVIRLWDPATGERIRQLAGHTGSVAALCATGSGDRTLLASGSGDSTARVWDPATGELLWTFAAGWYVRAVCWAGGSGSAILAAATNLEVRLWDALTGELLVRLPIGSHDPDSASPSALCAVTVAGWHGLAIGDSHGSVTLVDCLDGRTWTTLGRAAGWLTSICALTLPEGPVLACADQSPTFHLRDPARARPDRRLVDGDDVHLVAPVRVDERELLATAGETTIRLWDPVERRLVGHFAGHAGGITAVSRLKVHDRPMLASTATDGTIRLWDLRTAPATDEVPPPAGVTDVCPITVDGRTLLACAGDDATVRLREPATGAETRVLRGHTEAVTAVCAVTVDATPLVASAGSDSTIRLWDPRTARQLRVLACHTPHSLVAVPIRGRDALISGGGDWRLRVWDPRTGRPRRRAVHDKNGLHSLDAVDLGGRHLLTTGRYDGPLDLWELPRRRRTGPPLTGHAEGARVACTVTIDDERLLVSTGLDGTVRLWDPQTRQQRRVLSGHTDWVQAACSHTVGDWTLLVSGGYDRTLRLWDPRTGELIRTIPVHRVVTCCTSVAGVLVVGLNDGVLALRLTFPAAVSPDP
jgi:WD40 repeat protein